MVCQRCGGLKVRDFFYGATEYFAWQCHGLRCLNCGAVTNINPIESPGIAEKRASRGPRHVKAHV